MITKLSNKQQQVLATIHASANPAQAFAMISTGVHIRAAVGMLQKAKIIKVGSNEASVTDAGDKLSVALSITDSTGALTDTGQSLVLSDDQQSTASPSASVAESLDLFKQIDASSRLR